MPQSTSKKGSRKKAARADATNAATTSTTVTPLRTGLPALDSIQTEMTLTPPVASGKTFRIIRTFEVDAYEIGPQAEGVAVTLVERAAAAVGDNFTGTARKAAKLSIANAPTEQFNDLKNLIKSLAADNVMKSHNPPIKTSATSDRVKEEKRNVRVKAFLYAASRENDNDFHLIIGRDPSTTPEMYMTMELSALPPSSRPSFAKLKAARDAYKAFFDGNLPGLGYDFYDPPIPVLIEGSLFFDMTHASGQRPGPQSLKSRMPTIWEVHPITKIVLGP
jgi:hypothetical protein